MFKPLDPFKAVSFDRNAIAKVLEESGSLIADIKYDGVRVNLLFKDNKCLSMSRVGKPLPSIEWLDKLDESNWEDYMDPEYNPFGADGFWLDGELIVRDVTFEESSGIIRTKWLNEKTLPYHKGDVFRTTKGKLIKQRFNLDLKKCNFIVYGVIPFGQYQEDEVDIMTILMQNHCRVQCALLEQRQPEIFNPEVSEFWDVFDMDSLDELYESVRSQGHEGLVIKDPLAPYKHGKKVGWWKMKSEDTIDGEVVGIIWGTVGLANEGKVIGFEVKLEDGHVVDATGITKEQMTEFTANVKSNPEFYQSWSVQVKFMERTAHGSLRHPTFDCWRGVEGDPKVKM